MLRGLCCMRGKCLHLCPTLCDPVDGSLPGSSVHRILQARILEWVAMPSSRGSSWPRDWTEVSYVFCIGGFFTTSATWESPSRLKLGIRAERGVPCFLLDAVMRWISLFLSCMYLQVQWSSDHSPEGSSKDWRGGSAFFTPTHVALLARMFQLVVQVAVSLRKRPCSEK